MASLLLVRPAAGVALLGERVGGLVLLREGAEEIGVVALVVRVEVAREDVVLILGPRKKEGFVAA